MFSSPCTTFSSILSPASLSAYWAAAAINDTHTNSASYPALSRSNYSDYPIPYSLNPFTKHLKQSLSSNEHILQNGDSLYATNQTQNDNRISTNNLSKSKTMPSRDLKFGIDRILEETVDKSEEEDNSPAPNESKLTISPIRESSSYCTTSTSPSLTNAFSPTCSCSSAVCTRGHSTYVNTGPFLHYYHTLPSHMSNTHGISPHHNTYHPLGAYLPPRSNEFPGPYAVLGSTNHYHMSHGLNLHHASSQHPHHPQNAPKRKRSWSRAVFSHLQRKGLEKRFEVQKYVTKPDRKQLAAMLSLTDAQVKVWFQNRRMKWRHQEEAKRKVEGEERRKGNSSDLAKNSEVASPTETSPDQSMEGEEILDVLETGSNDSSCESDSESIDMDNI